MPSSQLHQHTRQGLHAGMKKWRTHSCRVLGAQLDLGSDSNNPCRSNLCSRAVSRLHACRVSRRKAQEDENYSGEFSTQITRTHEPEEVFSIPLSLTGPLVGEWFCYLFSRGSGSLTQLDSCQQHTFTQASSTPHSTPCKTPINTSTSLSHAMLSVLFSKCRVKSLVREAQGHTRDILEPWFSAFWMLPPFNIVLHDFAMS